MIDLCGLALAACALLGLLGLGPAAGFASGGHPTPLGLFGVDVVPGTPSAGDISESQAEAVAMDHTFGVTGPSGDMNPGVQVTAEFGTVTDSGRVDVSADGKASLPIDRTPMWVVSFSGAGVGFPAMGSLGPSGPDPLPTLPAGTATTETVLVNAETGRFVLGIN
jgi:hypothetical protein